MHSSNQYVSPILCRDLSMESPEHWPVCIAVVFIASFNLKIWKPFIVSMFLTLKSHICCKLHSNIKHVAQ